MSFFFCKFWKIFILLLPYFTIFLYFHLFISKHFETYLCTIRIIFVFVFVFVVILKCEYYSYSYSFDFEKRILFVFVFVWFWKTNIIRIRIRLILKNEYYSYSYSVQNYYSSHHLLDFKKQFLKYRTKYDNTVLKTFLKLCTKLIWLKLKLKNLLILLKINND